VVVGLLIAVAVRAYWQREAAVRSERAESAALATAQEPLPGSPSRADVEAALGDAGQGQDGRPEHSGGAEDTSRAVAKRTPGDATERTVSAAAAKQTPGDYDYSEYDAQMTRWGPLEDIGIPVRLDPASANLRVAAPSDGDRARIRKMEEEVKGAVASGLLSSAPRDNYVPVSLDAGETVYVAPQFRVRYESLLTERERIGERSLVPATGAEQAAAYAPKAPTRGQILSNGTELSYYRRRDGALIRSVKTPDGTRRRWVIGRADFSQYPEWVVNNLPAE
jgi:hypothetical protein